MRLQFKGNVDAGKLVWPNRVLINILLNFGCQKVFIYIGYTNMSILFFVCIIFVYFKFKVWDPCSKVKKKTFLNIVVCDASKDAYWKTELRYQNCFENVRYSLIGKRKTVPFYIFLISPFFFYFLFSQFFKFLKNDIWVQRSNTRLQILHTTILNKKNIHFTTREPKLWSQNKRE